MTTKEKAAAIRSELKNLGITSKQISVVKEHYSCIRLKLKVDESELDMQAVAKAAYKHEEIDRCERSGEILMGGNTFIFICNKEGYSVKY